MPRLSKKSKLDWSFFIDSIMGRRRYNDICRSCRRDCKQSFRAILIRCPRYLSKRSVRCENPANNAADSKPIRF